MITQSEHFNLNYYYENWRVEIVGETENADLARPSGLPYGEIVNNNLWTIKAINSSYYSIPNFTIKPVGKIFKRLSDYKVYSSDLRISKILSEVKAVSKYYNVEFARSNILEGLMHEGHYEIFTNLDTTATGNHYAIINAIVDAFEELITILNKNFCKGKEW